MVSPELAEMVRQVRRDGQILEREMTLERPLAAPLTVNARVAPLCSRLVLALLEDRTRERRVEAVRRDFVANVSHELKTPVGAIKILAEAVEDAADDPEAVRRFASRMRVESDRLVDGATGDLDDLQLGDPGELLDHGALERVDVRLGASLAGDRGGELTGGVPAAARLAGEHAREVLEEEVHRRERVVLAGGVGSERAEGAHGPIVGGTGERRAAE